MLATRSGCFTRLQSIKKIYPVSESRIVFVHSVQTTCMEILFKQLLLVCFGLLPNFLSYWREKFSIIQYHNDAIQIFNILNWCSSKWFNCNSTQPSNHPGLSLQLKARGPPSRPNVISVTWSPTHSNERDCLWRDFNNSHSLFISYKSHPLRMTHKNTDTIPQNSTRTKTVCFAMEEEESIYELISVKTNKSQMYISNFKHLLKHHAESTVCIICRWRRIFFWLWK